VNRHRYRTQTTARRRVALIGIAAILLQALLFGWHHHAVALPGDSGPIASIHSTDQPLAPATAEDLCEICVVLHQQTAAPLDFVLAPSPLSTSTTSRSILAVVIGRAIARGFDARAPPRA
jgi:hypothetical protein